MKDRNGNSKGVGFARIDDSKLCDVIIQELNGKSYPGIYRRQLRIIENVLFITLWQMN